MNTRSNPITKSGMKSPLAAAVAAALSGAPLAHANDAGIDEITVVEQARNYSVERSTSFKYTQPLVDTPKTITVITEDLLRDRNADSLQDGLRNVSGITLTAGEGGTPTGDSMFIRGFDARNDIMVDGVRDISGYTRDIYNIEAIEVAKGPGAAVYGRGSTGGNVNLQAKTARLEDVTYANLRGGSEGDYRATVDVNRSLGATTALRVNLLADDGGVAGRNEIENSKFGGAVSFTSGIETNSRITVNAEYQKQDNLPDYGLPWVPNYSGLADREITPELADYEGMAPPASFDNFYGNVLRDFEDIEARSLTARYERDISDATTFRAQFRTQAVERQTVVTAPRFAFTTVGGVRIYGPDITLADEKPRDTRDSLNVLQLDLLGHYETGTVQHDVVIGAEFAREEFKRYNFVDLVDDNLDSTPALNDLYEPDARLPYTGRYGRDGTSQLAAGDTQAIYAFDTMTFNPAWQLTLGLRWDHFDSDYQYDYADPDLRLAAVNEALSWSIGIVYKPAANGTFYFGSGTSFNPSAEDLTASTNGNQSELDPEESIGIEFGTKWELFDGRLLTTAALFRTEKTNARTDDPFVDDTFDTLNGRHRVDGFELGATGQISDRLSVSASYTLQDSEVVAAEGDDAALVGFELPRTPRHSSSFWGRYDFSERWTAGLGMQYVGDRYNSSDPGGREKAESFRIFDMMIGFQATENFGLQLNGSNLTDERYASQLGGGHFVPGEGRQFAIAANLTF